MGGEECQIENDNSSFYISRCRRRVLQFHTRLEMYTRLCIYFINNIPDTSFPLLMNASRTSKPRITFDVPVFGIQPQNPQIDAIGRRNTL